MFIAPHEFDRPAELPAGIGGNDGAAELQPGALFDNTQPYVFWAFAAKRKFYAADRQLESLNGTELHELARRMISRWGPELRQLVDETDTETVTLLPIRTSVPIGAWHTTNVTLIGDAIHSMTPFRGIGANIALRDAQVLCRQLVAAVRGERRLLDGIHAFETEMIDYGFTAVRNSLKTADMSVSSNRVGRIIGRTMFRTLNAIPPLRRKVFAKFGERLANAACFRSGVTWPVEPRRR